MGYVDAFRVALALLNVKVSDFATKSNEVLFGFLFASIGSILGTAFLFALFSNLSARLGTRLRHVCVLVILRLFKLCGDGKSAWFNEFCLVFESVSGVDGCRQLVDGCFLRYVDGFTAQISSDDR